MSLNLICCLHCRSIVVGSTLSLWPVVATQATCGGGKDVSQSCLLSSLPVHCSRVHSVTLASRGHAGHMCVCVFGGGGDVSQSYLLSSLPVHCSGVHSITLASRCHAGHMWGGGRMSLNLVCCLQCRSIVVGSTLSLWPVVAMQATCGGMSLNCVCCLQCRSIVVGSTLSLWPVVAMQATCGGGGEDVSQSCLLSSVPVHCSGVHSVTLTARMLYLCNVPTSMYSLLDNVDGVI